MKSLEQRLLTPTESLLDRAVADINSTGGPAVARLDVLEAAAACVGGWDVDEFHRALGQDSSTTSKNPRPWAEKLVDSIAATEIPVPLALSALSREVLSATTQRKTGAYYTDWRLAELLAATAVRAVEVDGPWIDPACGSGALLVAAVMQVPAGEARNALIRHRLVGADLSPLALRGTLLAVASLTDDLDAVVGFSHRLLAQDSLRSIETWAALAPRGAALVIGNPPWERLRLSRHEVVQSAGVARTYGQAFDGDVDLSQSRVELLDYVEQVAAGTRLQGKGEHDLYKLFLELALGVAAEGGVLAMLLPAGLIRSQGTEALRRHLSALTSELSVAVLENRAVHFAIDSRFKFLSVVGKIGQGAKKPMLLRIADRTGRLPLEPVEIDRDQLEGIRPDLTVPEVRTIGEWNLYRRLTTSAVAIGDSSGPWRPSYRREADMTSDRHSFRRHPGAGAGTLPLLEGRHVSQYRWRAKRYRSGEGRSAIWEPAQLNGAELGVQWHIACDALSAGAKERSVRSRIAFCDITGQTNERSLLVARVPAGVVCGNKVPTLAFPEGGVDREDLFLALTNSLVVDWMLRRTVTTSVNFFLLDGLVLPRVDEASAAGQELVTLARCVTGAEGDPLVDPRQVGRWRARLDALVAAAWGVDIASMALVLEDFPLLDRGQPPLPGETRSTVTQDSVLAELASMLNQSHPSTERLEAALSLGAVPFVPAEYAKERPWR